MLRGLDEGSAKRYQQRLAAIVVMAGLAVSTAARAQETKAEEGKYHADTYQTIVLEHMASNNQANDILTALRNVMPKATMYLNASAQMISVNASAADVALAQKIVAEMDKPVRTYRLTYTLTQIEDGKHTGSQRFALVVVSGDRAEMKQGTRVPILTGSFAKDSDAKESQVQYVDVGLSIDARAEGFQDGVKVMSKVEESSIGDEHSGFGAQDPVVHQTNLNATSVLPLGKPVALGALDVLGSTRRMEVEVTAELVR